MVVNKFKKIIYFSVVVALLGGIFIGGAFFGYSQRPEVEKTAGLFNKGLNMDAKVDFSPFWTAWNVINSKFVSKDKLDNQKRVWGAIEGMVKSIGDPYTVFFPPKQSKMFKEDISGQFGGVGMEIGVRKDVLIVIAPLKDTPAYRAGIKAGDKIIKIDDKISANMTAGEAAQFIRGKRGTSVKLTILRKNVDKPIEIKIIRDVIQVPVLKTQTKPGGIFVIKIYSFSANSANEFRKGLRKFVLSGDNKLILDLRGNPGGYMESAIDIASWFLPAGKVVVREKFGNGKENIYRSKGYNIFKKLSMVVLINEGSASASEILAGALSEQGVAKLVGEKSFGKGSVQELVQITPDTSLKVTIAKWLTPKGKSISENGLEPDVKVEFTKEDIEKGNDPQMKKAIELLNK
ncbi:MAG TPA: S41 family peptidase [bacterium]|nr:S41 family peptidase [bacterium]